ncbi:MAG: hypothetical protein INR65_18855, partial [Gluconacetobacter diazotrophicus]|nr:hypothetical protein [Gluconacetobacter diazotrophicus]
VRVTLGGFIEAASIFRTRNETADISSSFNTGIPLPQSPNYHQPELRESARQSRVSLLVEGSPNSNTALTAFFESDFNSAGVTSNSTESDSYTLRVRHVFAEYLRKDWDFYILGGQTWSLATMNKTGMVPRQEDIPLTIDAQYVPGFVWTRNAQIRFVKGFDKDRFALGLSFESPESGYYVASTTSSTNPAGLASNYSVNYQNPGLGGNGGTLNSTAQYTTEYAPDTILKATADPGYGHYEVFGMLRFPHDRVETLGTGYNHTKLAGGGGGGAILPIIKSKLDFQVSGLVGQGIGRYGSAQISDNTFQRDGAPQPVPEWMALAGLIYRPVKSVDLYSYVGTEQVIHREAFRVGNAGYGYGSPLYSNAGCEIENSPATCIGNTSGVVQGTVGGWWRFLKGDFGTMQTGVQYSYTRRSTFSGVGPTVGSQNSPSTDNNIIMFAFRYLPFQ